MKETDFSLETASRAQVLERLIDLIVWGKLGIDKKTSEKNISELLGFESRRPIVREALALLARDGIVGQRPQWGHWVPSVSVDEAKESLRFRAGVEKVVVEDLASSNEPVAPLEYMLHELEESASERDGADLLKKDAWYRRERARVAGFITGARAIRIWSDKLRIFRSEQNLDVIDLAFPLDWEEKEAIVGVHQIVLQSIKEQDVERAAAAIEQQSEDALRRLEEAISEDV